MVPPSFRSVRSSPIRQIFRCPVPQSASRFSRIIKFARRAKILTLSSTKRQRVDNQAYHRSTRWRFVLVFKDTLTALGFQPACPMDSLNVLQCIDALFAETNDVDAGHTIVVLVPHISTSYAVPGAAAEDDGGRC
jgi:hypothetical protein